MEKRDRLVVDVNATRDLLRAYIPLAREGGHDRLVHLLSNEAAVMARHNQSTGQLETNLAFARGIQEATYAILGALPEEAMLALRAKWYRTS